MNATPARVRAYLAWHRARRALRTVTDAVQTGLWLGAMDGAALDALDDAFYARSASYTGDAHNLRGLFPWERTALDAYFAGRRRVLLLGAGGGREALALARDGVRVDAFEPNPALAAYGAALLARTGCEARLAPLPRGALPPPGDYDAAVVGWSAYMLIPGRARRIDLLRGVAARLPPGAPLLLSFWTRAGDGRRERIVAGVGSAVRRLRGRPPLESGDDLAPNFVHRFTAEEVRAELAAAGFRAARFEPEGAGPYDSGWAVGVREGATTTTNTNRGSGDGGGDQR